MKLQSEINWFKELSELCDNYDLATTEFCCDKGLLRQDEDGSDSFTCCGSSGCGTNYSSQDISEDTVCWQLEPCSECGNECLFPLEEEYFICESCEEEFEREMEENEEEE